MCGAERPHEPGDEPGSFLKVSNQIRSGAREVQLNKTDVDEVVMLLDTRRMTNSPFCDVHSAGLGLPGSGSRTIAAGAALPGHKKARLTITTTHPIVVQTTVAAINLNLAFILSVPRAQIPISVYQRRLAVPFHF